MKNHSLKLLFIILIFSLLFAPIFASNKWAGVDENVVKKIAKEHNRKARKPIINTDKGDLLLFVFLVAGVIGGFAIGYFWRVLIEDKEQLEKFKDNGNI